MNKRQQKLLGKIPASKVTSAPIPATKLWNFRERKASDSSKKLNEENNIQGKTSNKRH